MVTSLHRQTLQEHMSSRETVCSLRRNLFDCGIILKCVFLFCRRYQDQIGGENPFDDTDGRGDAVDPDMLFTGEFLLL